VGCGGGGGIRVCKSIICKYVNSEKFDVMPYKFKSRSAQTVYLSSKLSTK
jgi:hypothetical protein